MVVNYRFGVYRWHNTVHYSDARPLASAVSGRKFGFEVLGDEKSFICVADTEEGREQWVGAISKHVEKKLAKRKSFSFAQGIPASLRDGPDSGGSGGGGSRSSGRLSAPPGSTAVVGELNARLLAASLARGLVLSPSDRNAPLNGATGAGSSPAMLGSPYGTPGGGAARTPPRSSGSVNEQPMMHFTPE